MGTKFQLRNNLNKIIYNYFNQKEIFKKCNEQISDIAVHSIDTPIDYAVESILMIVDRKLSYSSYYEVVDACIREHKEYYEMLKEHYYNGTSVEDCAKKFKFSLKTMFERFRYFRKCLEDKLRLSGVDYEN